MTVVHIIKNKKFLFPDNSIKLFLNNDQITDKECSVRVNRRFKKLKEYYNYYKNEPIQLLVFLFYITFFLLILFTFWVIYKIFKLFFIIINRLSRKAFNSKLFNIFRKKKIV